MKKKSGHREGPRLQEILASGYEGIEIKITASRVSQDEERMETLGQETGVWGQDKCFRTRIKASGQRQGL